MLAAVFVNIRLFPMHPGLRPEDCERCAGPLVSNRRPAGYWNAEDGGENEFAHLGVRFGGSGIELVPEVFQQRRLGDSDGPGDFRHGDAIARPWLRLGRAGFLWVRIVDGRLRPLCRSLKITLDCTHAPSPRSAHGWRDTSPASRPSPMLQPPGRDAREANHHLAFEPWATGSNSRSCVTSE